MAGKHSSWKWVRIPLLVLLVLSAAWSVRGEQVKGRLGSLDDLAFARDELRVAPRHQDLNEVRSETSLQAAAGFDRFLMDFGGDWQAQLDRLSGRIALMEGTGIPWIPGAANPLSGAALGLRDEAEGRDIPMALVAAKALRLLQDNPDLLGVDPEDLVLNAAASGPVAGHLYLVEFSWTHQGLPVENAYVVFRLNNGNLVQVGQENTGPAIDEVDTTPSLFAETAWEMVSAYIGGLVPEDRILEPGRLLIVPVASPGALSGKPFPLGEGLGFKLVWLISFRRQGEVGTWEARVDAHTGEILSFLDGNKYGKVHGGAYRLNHEFPETDVPFRRADLGGGLFSDESGFFAGNSATTTLDGQYVKIADTCGAISRTTATGDQDFGSGAGTDCTTPGTGGAGNTHAARTQFYITNLAKRKAMMYLPANAWLAGKLTDNVNISAVCNAYWTGSAINFYRSVDVGGGTTCGNSGEFATSALHEFAHGLDSNDGNGFSPDGGTGETYGDFTAMLYTHLSCHGIGRFTNPGGTVNCGGYGNPCTNCTGIRELDFARHTDPTPSVPTMLDGATGYRCSLNAGCHGPCGYECHCESIISTQALWDLVNRDLVGQGLDLATAWELLDKYWYWTRSTATSAYACPTLATSDGCGAGSLYTVFRWADDVDGDLTNGTPHAGSIFAALNRHRIACGAAGDARNKNHAECGAIGTPTVTGALGTNQITLSWTAVAGAVNYEVYRNEADCDGGHTLLATVAAPGLTYTDTTALGGLAFNYRVQAVGANRACMGSMSNCLTRGGPLSGTASGTPVTGVAPLTVNFTGQGLDGTPPYIYSWNFGDGSPSGSGATTSHAYATGNWTATLAITDSGTPAKTFAPPPISISVAPPLAVTSSADKTLGEDPAFLVNFTSNPTGGFPPYTYSWNFGDGSPLDTTANPAHTYTVPGVFTVSLTVKDSGSPQNTASAAPLTITVLPHVTATAAAAPIFVAPASPVAFTGAAAQGQGPYTFAWDFGDGGTSAAQNLSHSYAAVGDYPVTLTVADSLMYTATDSHLLIHVCTLTCAATVPATGVVAFPVSFASTATLTGSCPGPIAYAWTFGDGGTAATQDATHTYAAGGTFAWTLTVTANGLTCSQAGTIKICPYNVGLADDYGRSRLCFNTATGAWQWTVLRGPGIGTYAGAGVVSLANGVFYLYSLPGEPWTLTAKYMQTYKKASASFSYRPLRFTSVLTDTNTTNNPPCCP